MKDIGKEKVCREKEETRLFYCSSLEGVVLDRENKLLCRVQRQAPSLDKQLFFCVYKTIL